MRIKYWGVRGSIPTPEKENAGYGGNTTCIELESEKGSHCIIDAGSGVRKLGYNLMAKHQGKPFEANLFMTHIHWDHIQGFPFFVPAYVPGVDLTVYSGRKRHRFQSAMNVRGRLERLAKNAARDGRLTEYLFDLQQSKYVFPVTVRDMLSKPKFIDLKDGEIVKNGVTISHKNFEFGHPEGMTSYKFTENGKTFVVQADFEHNAILPSELRGANLLEKDETAKMHEELLGWWKDADLVYYDSMYLPEEYDPQSYGKQGMSKKTWGHSTYEKGIDFALEAGVKHLVLGHHDPLHDDKSLDELFSRANLYLAKKSNGRVLELSMAKEGLEHLLG